MDAHKLYVEFVQHQKIPTGHFADENTERLIQLMRATESGEQKSTDKKAGESLVTESETVETRPNTPTEDELSSAFDKISLEGDFIHECDTLIAQHSRPRIDALARNIDARVKMSWVHAFASSVESKTPVPIDRYETLVSGSSRHTHIVSNSVLDFLQCLKNVAMENITTFAWSHGATKAIHIQKFEQHLLKRFQSCAALSTVVIASIGLPLHEIIKAPVYLDSVRRKGNVLSNKNIIKTILDKKIHIEKINSKLEENQLIEEYEKNEHLFDVTGTFTDVHMFMFKHWYSYPTAIEMKTLLERAKGNLTKWTGIEDFSPKK